MGRMLRGPFLRLAFSFLGIVPAFSQAPLSVVHTGRALGHFRYPEQQPRVNFDRCVDAPSTMSQATSDFLAALRKQGTPVALFQLPKNFMALSGNPGQYIDVTSDNQRFLVEIPVIKTPLDELTVVLNWPGLLHQASNR
jgi:hypothetical protein